MIYWYLVFVINLLLNQTILADSSALTPQKLDSVHTKVSTVSAPLNYNPEQWKKDYPSCDSLFDAKQQAYCINREESCPDYCIAERRIVADKGDFKIGDYFIPEKALRLPMCPQGYMLMQQFDAEPEYSLNKVKYVSQYLDTGPDGKCVKASHAYTEGLSKLRQAGVNPNCYTVAKNASSQRDNPCPYTSCVINNVWTLTVDSNEVAYASTPAKFLCSRISIKWAPHVLPDTQKTQ